MRKLFTVLLCALMLITAYPPLLAEAAGTKETPVAAAEDTATGTEVFEGFTVTILDKTAPATEMRGRMNDPDWMCFVSADDREIGVISYNDYLAIIEKNKTLIRHANGSISGVPPDGYTSWHEWFADEFNQLRGLGAGSREEAVVTETSATIEEYRQEVIKLVNEEREKEGLFPYIMNDRCMEYSQLRAQELLTLFSHTRPDGTYAGYEIISAKSKTPAGVVAAWMESSGHKAAILSADHSFVGSGCYITSNGGVYWQMFFALDPELHANSFLNTTN